MILIKFFVDNLEKFGLERLLSRILNKGYCDLFINDNRFDNKNILFSNIKN